MPQFLRPRALAVLYGLGCFALLIRPLEAGVSKEIQNSYVRTYENRAMYLKVPIHGARQIVFVSKNRPALETSNIGQPALFKVGDQVRISDVVFRNSHVRFRVTSVDGAKLSELHFVFPYDLTNLFPQKPYFDEALNYALTQGLSYRDIEAARQSFVDDQFDRLINQFAGTAGIGRDQLLKMITDESPDFQKAKSELASRTTELQQERELLANEKAGAQALARKNAGLQRDIREAEAAADSLKAERLNLLDERDQLKMELSLLEAAQARWQRDAMQYEQQVDDLIRNLDLQGNSSNELDNLDNKVASLSDVIDELKLEGSQLSDKLRGSGKRVAELLQQNQQLEKDIRKVRNQKARIESNLKVLTTGKNNINKTLLEVQQERDYLAAARNLQSALNWSQQAGPEDRRLAVISIHEHKVAEFEMEEPGTVDHPYSFQLRLDSPDLVKFDEEERALYEQLGETVSVEMMWKTGAGIEANLVEGEVVQEVAPRGQANWSWRFSGELGGPQPVVLSVRIKDANGHQVQLAEREFILRSAGLSAALGQSFSLWSLLIGLATGLSVVLLLRRSKPVKQTASHPVEYMAKKRL